MARFSASFRSAGAGSTTLPLGSLYATTGVRPVLVEVGVFNTTTTAVNIALVRLSAGTGTKGSAITIIADSDTSQAAVATVANTHTVTPTTISTPFRVAPLAGAVGSGVIWTFGGPRGGTWINNTTTDAIAVIIASGTGQICDISFTWDE